MKISDINCRIIMIGIQTAIEAEDNVCTRSTYSWPYKKAVLSALHYICHTALHWFTATMVHKSFTTDKRLFRDYTTVHDCQTWLSNKRQMMGWQQRDDDNTVTHEQWWTDQRKIIKDMTISRLLIIASDNHYSLTLISILTFNRINDKHWVICSNNNRKVFEGHVSHSITNDYVRLQMIRIYTRITNQTYNEYRYYKIK